MTQQDKTALEVNTKLKSLLGESQSLIQIMDFRSRRAAGSDQFVAIHVFG